MGETSTSDIVLGDALGAVSASFKHIINNLEQATQPDECADHDKDAQTINLQFIAHADKALRVLQAVLKTAGQINEMHEKLRG